MTEFKPLLALTLAAAVMFAGCTFKLPFNHELSGDALAQIRQDTPRQDVKIHLQWVPSSFVTRIDIKGADGFVGGGTKTHIPTGPGLSLRIEAALAEVLVLDDTADPLIITVEDAQSNFEYSSFMLGFPLKSAIGMADVTFKAHFSYKELSWRGEYEAHYYEPSLIGTTETLMMEKAWDDIAVQVAKDVAEHLQSIVNLSAEDVVGGSFL